MDFCDTLAAILKTAKAEQRKNCFRYGELYSLNYYSEVKEKDRTYYEVAKRRKCQNADGIMSCSEIISRDIKRQ